MSELLTAAQMRAIEKAAIDSGDVTGLELMERAGRGVVEAIFEEWPELAKTDHRAVVLCGPGNNGGDGFVVARLLKEWGWEVEVFLYGDAEKLPPDARENYERWCGMGEVLPNSLLDRDYLVANYDFIIDAVFGTGLSRPLAGDARAFCKAMWQAAADVSIDVPSGFCADSGRYLDAERNSYDGPDGIPLVVTFERPRVGHFLAELAQTADQVAVKEIGVDNRRRHWRDRRIPSFRRDSTVVSLQTKRVYRANEKDAIFPQGRTAHKYTHGHAYILSGPSGHTGAARLAARGALRIGAGLVSVACPPDALAEHAAQLNAIMLTAVADAGALAKRLEDERINALCLGPALGVNDGSKALVLAALKAKRATVLDADALTVFADEPQVLFDALHDNCVLTPHGGEFRRLFPDIAEKLDATPTKGPAYSKVDATREAAARAGCVVLFKGPDTVIAAPDGRCSINSAQYERAAPWLATAGSGDVLAGFITGLLARGYNATRAAEAAAWLHVECARKFGPGLIAEDLPEQLPAVLIDLLT